MIFRSFFRDENDDQGGSGAGGDDGAGDGGVDNAAIKASPLFQKLTAELKAEREGREVLAQEKTDRAAAEQAAADEAEQERLKKDGLFDEAAAKYKAADEAKDAKHAAELQKRDIEAALLRANFRNEHFNDGVVSKYNAEKDGTIEEYVTALAADEVNAAFITALGNEGDPPPKAPGKTTVTPAGKTNWEEVKNWENNGTREEKQKARKLIGKYHDEHGEYPYKNQ